MATVRLTVTFSTLAGEDARRLFIGDPGVPLVPGMWLDFGANPPSALRVRIARVEAAAIANAIVIASADGRIFEDITTAQAFRAQITSRAQAMGWTVS